MMARGSVSVVETSVTSLRVNGENINKQRSYRAGGHSRIIIFLYKMFAIVISLYSG